MKSLSRILDNTQSIMKTIAAFSLMGMCLMTCADVFLRSMLNRPIFGSEEIVSIFAVLAIGFALPYSHKKGSHVGVEILVRLLSKKNQTILRFFTNLLSFSIFAGAIAESRSANRSSAIISASPSSTVRPYRSRSRSD